MTVYFLLVLPVTVGAIVGAAAVLLESVRRGDLDEVEGRKWRILLDEDRPLPP